MLKTRYKQNINPILSYFTQLFPSEIERTTNTNLINYFWLD